VAAVYIPKLAKALYGWLGWWYVNMLYRRSSSTAAPYLRY